MSSQLLLDDTERRVSEYPVNWISVGQKATDASAALGMEYWSHAKQTGYVGVNMAREPGLDGLDWLPNGGAALKLAPGGQDMINAKRALTPYVDSMRDLLSGAKLNAVLAYLGNAFPSGVTPSAFLVAGSDISRLINTR